MSKMPNECLCNLLCYEKVGIVSLRDKVDEKAMFKKRHFCVLHPPQNQMGKESIKTDTKKTRQAKCVGVEGVSSFPADAQDNGEKF